MNLNIEYLVAEKRGGANPSLIWSSIQSADPDKLANKLKRLTYKDFLKTAYWFAVATKRKSEMNMLCQICNQGEGIQLHHRTYEIHGYEHRHMNDLTVLCGICHGVFHGHLPAMPQRLVRERRVRIKTYAGTIVPHEPQDLNIPDGEIITLTKELVDRCRANGSFTNATLRALGITKATMTQGWPIRLEGKQMTREQYTQAQQGRYIYNSGRLE